MMDDAALVGGCFPWTPAFIVGASRSGTTWLQLCLSQSPSVATAQETHLFSLYLRSLFRTSQDLVAQPRGIGLSPLIGDDALLAWAGEFSRSCLDKIAEKKPGAAVILEKTPDHVRCAGDILRLFPNARFIHVIRDPRAVAASLRAASGSWGAGWAPRRIADCAAGWKAAIAAGRRIPFLTANYCEVFYERMHTGGPEEVLRVLEWLGVTATATEAGVSLRICSIGGLRQGFAAAPWALTSEPEGFYRRGEVESWREELSGVEIAIVERLARKEMAELGYQPVAGPRDRAIAKARLKAYRLAGRAADAVRAGAERLQP